MRMAAHLREMSGDYARITPVRQALIAFTFLIPFVVVAMAAAVAQEREKPARIVSVNLCADQLLLALADPDQIVALSRNATSRLLSDQAQVAQRYPQTSRHAEDVILMAPDLVIAGRFAGATSKAAIRRAGFAVHELDVPGTPAGAADQLEAFGVLIGQPERGRSEAAALRAAFAQARAAAPESRPSAVYLQRRGIVTGTGTMMHALMEAAGLRNAVDEPGFLQIGIERLISIDADLLILDGQGLRADGDAADQGAAILAHPLVRKTFPTHRRVIVPNPEIICAGPSLARAVGRLSSAANAYAGAGAAVEE